MYYGGYLVTFITLTLKLYLTKEQIVSNIFFYLTGEAEAFAIEAKAKAEAEQMAKKAEAWNEYKQAALVDMVLKVMPKLAAEVAGK